MDLKQYSKIIVPALGETIYMVVITFVLSFVLSFFIAIVMYLTNKVGLRENKTVYKTLDILINITRAFPFVILIVAVIPLTKFIVGTSIGVNAAIVPLTISSTSLITRMFKGSFDNVDKSEVEAGRSFGLTDFQIIKHIVVKESVPNLISDCTIGVISILGFSAIAGAVGAGGLGTAAILYGYQTYNNNIMYGTVLVIIVLVTIIQTFGNFLYNKSKV